MSWGRTKKARLIATSLIRTHGYGIARLIRTHGYGIARLTEDDGLRITKTRIAYVEYVILVIDGLTTRRAYAEYAALVIDGSTKTRT